MCQGSVCPQKKSLRSSFRSERILSKQSLEAPVVKADALLGVLAGAVATVWHLRFPANKEQLDELKSTNLQLQNLLGKGTSLAEVDSLHGAVGLARPSNEVFVPARSA